MKVNPTISVIIPVYNAAKALNRCLNSIIAQDFKDFEVLLVDDGSTDDSGKICDEYLVKDERVKVFHKKNGGASSARNVGLENAEGKYITFCDADDYVESNWLSEFERNNKDVDIVISSFFMHHVSYGTKSFIYDCDSQLPALAASLLVSCGECGFLWNKCFRADIIRKNHITFNEGYKLYEDEEFVTNYMAHARNVSFSSELTYHYFVANDFSKKYQKVETLPCVIQIYNHLLLFVPQDRFYMTAYSAIIDRMLASINIYYYRKQYGKAYNYLKELNDYKKKMCGIRLPINRQNRFLFKRNIVVTHFIWILLSLFNKL
jgi:glycosyltransferase involved in cell wall biosynthesis